MLKTIIFRYIALFFVVLLLTWFLSGLGHCQVSPIQGLGSIQLFNNNGTIATAGCFYFYQAGTTTQQATFTDSTGSTQNSNPLCVSTGARATVWLTTSQFYKIVGCVANDGSFCAAADVLFSQDNVPGGATGTGGVGGSPFISSSANPSTTGILRLASGDSICWRNAANSANLCISKDSSDVLSWASGILKFPETNCSLSSLGFDYLCADSTTHRWKFSGNGGSQLVFAAQGVDINSSDQVTQLHFGATGEPLSTTAPTTNQVLQFNGTNIQGTTLLYEMSMTLTGNGLTASSQVCGGTGGTSVAQCIFYVFANAHTLTRLVTQVQGAPVGCTTNAVYGLRDVTAATNLTTVTPSAAGFTDSGALSIAMPAGHTFALGLLTLPTGGCSPFIILSSLTANYQ